MKLVVPIVGNLVVYVVFKGIIGAVTLPVFNVEWIIAVATATSCAGSAVTRYAAAIVASRCVAVTSAIISWARLWVSPSLIVDYGLLRIYSIQLLLAALVVVLFNMLFRVDLPWLRCSPTAE